MSAGARVGTRGSKVLDRRFRGVGRIKRASGTTHARTFARLNEMLTQLYEQGRFDLLVAIQNGALTPLEVFSAWRVGKLDRLPTAEMLQPLTATMRAWAERYDCSDDHRDRTLLQAVRYFDAAQPDAKVGELPAVLESLRRTMKATPVAFNRTRSAAQAFVRDTMKRSHPLYRELAGVEALPVTSKRPTHPQPIATVAQVAEQVEVRAIADGLDAGWGQVVWAMALTGMGPKELHGDWELVRALVGTPAVTHVHIAGTKRAARDRLVPGVWTERYPSVRPILDRYSRDRCYRLLLGLVTTAGEALGITVEPYDFRRSYANYLEAAGILRTRRRLYRGHAAAEVGDLYEAHEVQAFLAEDAQKLTDYLDAELDKASTALTAATAGTVQTPERSTPKT